MATNTDLTFAAFVRCEDMKSWERSRKAKEKVCGIGNQENNPNHSNS